MPPFNVVVVSTTPEQTKEALERAGIPTLAAFSYVAGALNEGVSVGPRMTAVVEARTDVDAVARVREVVGEDCNIQPEYR
jgi:hypothetical protein